VDQAVARFAKTYEFEIEIAEPPPIDIGAAFQAIIALETDLSGMRRTILR